VANSAEPKRVAITNITSAGTYVDIAAPTEVELLASQMPPFASEILCRTSRLTMVAKGMPIEIAENQILLGNGLHHVILPGIDTLPFSGVRKELDSLS